MLINTSRGALINTQAAIEALKTGQLGYMGIDVYEQEEKLFFHNLSGRDHPRRCHYAADELPQCAGHCPPGFLYRRGPYPNCTNYPAEYQRL